MAGWAGVVLLVACASTFGWSRWSRWRLQRSLQFASAYIEREDYRGAFLLLDALVRTNPTNSTARRQLAEVLEYYAPAEALVEWETLVRFEPGEPRDLVGCVTAQLRVGQVDQAEATLARLAAAAPASSDRHRLTAAVALARRDEAALRAALAAWSNVEPANPSARLGLATLELADPGAASGARVVLEELARGDRLRIRAVLALLADAPRRWPNATKLADQAEKVVRQLAGRGWPAPLLSLTRPALPPMRDLGDLVAYMKAETSPLPEDTARLARWLQLRGRAREALLWLDTLPESSLRSSEAMEARISCAADAGAWPRVEAWLIAGAWGPASPRTIGLALQARDLFERGETSRARGLWNTALAESAHSVPDLRLLQRFAQLARWPADRQLQVLWQLVRQFPGDRVAWRLLSERAQSTREVSEMWRVYTAWRVAEPGNMAVQLELLLLGLLARPQEPDLAIQAENIFRARPGLSAARVVHALGEWRSGRAREALALLDAAPLDYGAEPRFLLVHGLVLASLSRHAEAAECFAQLPAGALLAEEAALVAAVRAASP